MAESNKSSTYDFPRPSLTVDVMLLTIEPRPRVLLTRRKHEPFAGRWAFPGGFVEENEPLEVAARRELKEETGLEGMDLEQVGAFGDPGRDPRGWTVTVVFLGRVDAANLHPRAADDAAQVAWHVADAPPALAFDHARILEIARHKCSHLAPRDDCSARGASGQH